MGNVKVSGAGRAAGCMIITLRWKSLAAGPRVAHVVEIQDTTSGRLKFVHRASVAGVKNVRQNGYGRGRAGGWNRDRAGRVCDAGNRTQVFVDGLQVLI